MNKKKYIALLISSIVIVAVATISITYAYLSFNATQVGTNVIESSCFSISFVENSDSINLSATYPMSSDKAFATISPYKFTITNTCTNGETNYQIILNIKNTTSDTLLPYINYSLDGTTTTKITAANTGTLPSSLLTSDTKASYVIKTGTLPSLNSSETFNLYLWIDESAGNDVMNLNFTAEVMVYNALGNNEPTTGTVTLTGGDYILSNIETINERSSFSSILTESTTKTIYKGTDSYGTTYYYAGAPTDNYLKFAGFWWRIIRINGDGTIRIIYAGKESDYSTGLSNGYNDSTTLYESIGTKDFNSASSGQRHTGYYHSANTFHGTGEASSVATLLNNWYADNILTDYNAYVSQNTMFCNDRLAYADASGTESATTNNVPIYFVSYVRNITNKTPSLLCGATEDTFTKETTNATIPGNGVLDYPIGLITADEIAYAGGVYNTTNNSYYLYTGTVSWTMSPGIYDTSRVARMLHIGGPGGINYTSGATTATNHVRPVINLKSSVNLTGSGTNTDPYVVS